MPALVPRLVVIAGLAVAFLAMTMAVAAGTFTTLDHDILVTMSSLWDESLHVPFQAIAELGSLELTTVLVVGLAIYLWRNGLHADAWVVLAFIATMALEVLYKVNLYHPGPPRSVSHNDGPSITELIAGTGPLANSFPSGHVLRAVVVYGLLAFVVRRLSPSPLLRTLAIPVATLAILLVSFSRLYLDVHYESDVIGGLVLGAIGFLSATVWLDRPIRADN